MTDMMVEVLVCYDIQDNRRRQRLADALKDLGLESVQKSVFWGFLTLTERKRLPALFEKNLESGSDVAFCVPAGISAGDVFMTFGYGLESFTRPKRYEVV